MTFSEKVVAKVSDFFSSKITNPQNDLQRCWNALDDNNEEEAKKFLHSYFEQKLNEQNP